MAKKTSQGFLVSGDDYLAARAHFRFVARPDAQKQVSNILLGETRNSAILTGRRGVGITSLIMGLQMLKQDPDAPFDIAGKEFYWLDTDELFSSGDLREINRNFQTVIDTMTELSDTVLVIQNAKEFIDAAKTRNCAHFINALMLALDEGKFQAILESRDNHLPEVMACHPRFEEVFTPLEIEEPDPASLKKIVAEAVKKMEIHNLGIGVAPEAQEAAHKLLARFPVTQLDMAQPGLTVQLIESSLNEFRLQEHAGIDPAQRSEIRDIRAARLTKEKELVFLRTRLESRQQDLHEKIKGDDNYDRPMAAFTAENASAGQEEESVADLQEKIEKLRREVEEKRAAYEDKVRAVNRNLVMPASSVYAQFSKMTGIPVTNLSQDEQERLLRLEDDLSRRVVGQPDPVRAVARAVRSGRLNLKAPKEPIGSFLFLGPSGTGKTELAKALALFLFGGEGALQRYDMSEYNKDVDGALEKFRDNLVERMRRRPYCVNVLDEIEKGHHKIPDLFLQVMEDGLLTSTHGLRAHFANAVNIVTSNIGQEHFYREEDFATACKKALEDLRNPETSIFRNEVLNRFTGIFCFRPLGDEQVQVIARNRINKLNDELREKGFSIHVDDQVLAALCANHYEKRGGARSVLRYIRNSVVDDSAIIVLQNPDVPGLIEVSYNAQDKRAETKLAPKTPRP